MRRIATREEHGGGGGGCCNKKIIFVRVKRFYVKIYSFRRNIIKFASGVSFKVSRRECRLKCRAIFVFGYTANACEYFEGLLRRDDGLGGIEQQQISNDMVRELVRRIFFDPHPLVFLPAVIPREAPVRYQARTAMHHPIRCNRPKRRQRSRNKDICLRNDRGRGIIIDAVNHRHRSVAERRFRWQKKAPDKRC